MCPPRWKSGGSISRCGCSMVQGGSSRSLCSAVLGRLHFHSVVWQSSGFRWGVHMVFFFSFLAQQTGVTFFPPCLAPRSLWRDLQDSLLNLAKFGSQAF